MTEQDDFWTGDFGTEYINRNKSQSLFVSDLSLFDTILKSTSGICSAIEFGANVGLNLMALKTLVPEIDLTAVEINETAINQLRTKMPCVDARHMSMIDYEPNKMHDMSFTKGVLIHLHPDDLDRAYEVLYKSSRKYVCMIEYYNPCPVSVVYRGYENKLFKRDFAGEFIDKYGARLVDYGFVYHRDRTFPQNDVTWFLLEK